MMNWSAFWSYLNRSLSLFLGIFFFVAMQSRAQTGESSLRASLQRSPVIKASYYESLQPPDTTAPQQTFPDPTSVLYKSLMIPGWGQIVNGQIWKVPIVYGLLAGLTIYSIRLTKRFHDFRAAYYNKNEQTSDDMRFGPTPAYLADASSLRYLRDTRNSLKNRRDLIYITIALAYGLNALDAYIFAHLRSFDVSKDLSVRTTLKPNMLAYSTPGITLSFELFNNDR